MKDYKPKDIRNFAVVGHASSGKTMLAEAMLACGGVINRMGSIEAGSTVSDYHTSEKDHQISVHASLLNTEWLGKKFNIIDTPGYMDFISEGLGAIRVGDFALVVVNAGHGIGVGTDQVWEYATHYGIPKMLVINDLDKEHTDFDESLEVKKHKLQKATKEFESFFILHMLKAMRKTIPKSEIFKGGLGQDVYTSMFDEELAQLSAAINDGKPP